MTRLGGSSFETDIYMHVRLFYPSFSCPMMMMLDPPTWNDEAIARCLAEEEEVIEEDDDDWSYWASSEFGESVGNDEAIAACLAAEFEAADKEEEEAKKSILEVAKSNPWQVPRVHRRQRVMSDVKTRTEQDVAELERSAERSRAASLVAHRDAIRCCGIERKQTAQNLRQRASLLRDESCACYLAARNPELVPFPAPSRFDDAVRILAASLRSRKDPQVDLHMLPRSEALVVLDASLRSTKNTGARRLSVVVGRGSHSSGAPKLGPSIQSHLRKSGTRHDYDQTRGVVVVYLSFPGMRERPS